MSEQVVNIPIPLELFGWSYICDNCGSEFHISRVDPHPNGPMITYHECPNCLVKINLVWMNREGFAEANRQYQKKVK